MFEKSKKHAGRIKEIIGVFTKHGLGTIFVRIGLGDYVRGRMGEATDISPQGVRSALEELGPTFVKFGQILSTRPDLIPESYAQEFSKLQDTAPVVPLEQIEKVVLQEFGSPASDVFDYFNEIPLAAASLAQVHAARLKDGREVIVKVQRPGIRDKIEADIEILYRLARLLESRWERARTYRITELVDEFAITIREELDYTREGRNTDRLRSNLADVKEVLILEVYWELTTPRVLTIERLHGVKITDIDDLKAKGYDLKLIAQRLASVFLKQIYVDGFFHADPHPGNILVTADQIIGLFDCGQVGRLDATAKAGAIRMLVAFEQEDTRQFAQEIISLGITQGDIDMPAFTRDIDKLLRNYYDVPARSVNMGMLLTRTLDVSAKHRVRLPVSFAVLAKVLANIDSINRQLDPDFNFTEVARPYVNRAVRQEFNLSNLTADLYRGLIDLKSLMFSLPENMDQLLRKLVAGTFRIELKPQGLDDFANKLDKMMNRLAFAIIVTGVIIGSSLVVVAGRGPKGWFGYPLLGLVGYLLAVVLGLYLVMQIIRTGRLH